MTGAFAAGAHAGAREAAARIIHDLHSPLTVIRGLCAALARDEARPERRRAIDLIDGEALRLAAGLQGLARASGPVDPQAVEPVDLAALAAGVAERFEPAARYRGVRIETRGVGAAAWTAGAPSEIERIVDNLVQNALRHCPRAGTVMLAVASRGGRVVLRVRDDGDGVPPGDRERVFAPGDRGSAPRGTGRGLGLAIAREIAERHGGRLTLDSVGTGACFRLSLPLHRDLDAGPRSA